MVTRFLIFRTAQQSSHSSQLMGEFKGRKVGEYTVGQKKMGTEGEIWPSLLDSSTCVLPSTSGCVLGGHLSGPGTHVLNGS